MPGKNKHKSSLEESIIIIGLRLFLHVSFHRNGEYRVKDRLVHRETRLLVSVSAETQTTEIDLQRQLLLELPDAKYKTSYVFFV